MPVNDSKIDHKNQIQEWFKGLHQSVTSSQILLALDFMKNYGYSVDVACPLALESNKSNKFIANRR